MEKSIAVTSALAAGVSIAVSAYSIYKWMNAEASLLEYTNKFESMKEIQKHLIHSFVALDEFPKLSPLIPGSALSFHDYLAKYCSEMCSFYEVPLNRILDVGCGVGGLSFNLSKTFKEVVGTDTSYKMINAGQQLKQFSETATYFPIEGGKYIKMMKTKVPEHSNRERVTFWDEDVCALVYKCGKFNCVVAANVITDLSNPKLFLAEIADYVEPNGLLIIADTYNWKNGPEEFLGGDGDKLTINLLKEILSPNWTFRKTIDLPFCIPQCNRLAMIGTAEVLVWQKKTLEF